MLSRDEFLDWEEFLSMGSASLPGACRTEGYSAVPLPFSTSDMTFRGLGHRLVDTLAAYLDKLPQEPVYRPLPAEVRRELERMETPAEGVTREQILESFLRLVLPYAVARTIRFSPRLAQLNT
jgi:hypothetical protein